MEEREREREKALLLTEEMEWFLSRGECVLLGNHNSFSDNSFSDRKVLLANTKFKF